ncbi:hypothetical protein [Dactylosporangium sp. NPDC006015]|uniref:hypothetical protein n=1 Tax=Dactylosporangium sp. NPDC006015 TaxID=3154576 RepID=UPI0033A1BC53
MHRHTPQTVVAGLTAAALGTAVMAAPADGSAPARPAAAVDELADFQPTEISRSEQQYGLVDQSTTFDDAIDKFKGQDIPQATLTDVLEDANHSAEAPCGVPPTADSVQFCWNDEDSDGTTWIPQGLTGSWDADADGRWNGHRAIAATWYDDKGRDGTKRGSRITFVNYDDAGKPEYRHVLLVVPFRNGESFQAVRSHGVRDVTANMNGAITFGDAPGFVLSTSEYGRRPGWLHRATVGTSNQHTKVLLGGPEDLTYQPQGKRMWTLTEHNGRRTVFGIPLSSIG